MNRIDRHPTFRPLAAGVLLVALAAAPRLFGETPAHGAERAGAVSPAAAGGTPAAGEAAPAPSAGGEPVWIHTWASALADSLEARLSSRHARVIDTTPPRAVLDIGSDADVRRWSILTLVSEQGEAWTGEVSRLSTDRVELKAVDGEHGAPPEKGSAVAVRLNVRRTAVPLMLEGPGVSGRAASRLTHALEEILETRHGLSSLRVAWLPDTLEARGVAADAGTDLLLWPAAARYGNDLRVTLGVTETRRAGGYRPIVTVIPLSESDRDWLAAGDSPEESPPGLRLDTVRSDLPGHLLDLIAWRHHKDGVLAYFPDRIEALRITPGRIETVARYDLTSVWPARVPTRWPVGEILALNTYYSLKKRDESKVIYNICSNQRPRFLSMAVDKETPDTLYFQLASGPSDSITASWSSCFPKLDRVDRPTGWKQPVDLPATATARTTLNSLLMGSTGKPVHNADGTLRTQREALVYYDEPSATLWVASPDTAGQVAGRFGGEMDSYRVGHRGAPSLLITSGSSPGEDDRLELWTFRHGRMSREWLGSPLPGAITAIHARDIDGDDREDLVVAVVTGRGAFARTEIRTYSSRPAGGAP